MLLRSYLPEFLAALVCSVLLLIGYSMRGEPGPMRTPHPRSRVQARFLVEIEKPEGKLRVDLGGEVSGLAQGRLNATELNDLRQAVAKLRDGASKGVWKIRFYDGAGAHEVSFEAGKMPADVGPVVENLRVLGYLK